VRTKVKFATPDPEREKAELMEHYEQVLATDDDEEGLGPDALTRIGNLANVLKGLKKKKR
jgi:hypothetical protein